MLASAASRLSSETAWTILETLAQQSENASDRKLPRLIWHALASRLASDLIAGQTPEIDAETVAALSPVRFS